MESISVHKHDLRAQGQRVRLFPTIAPGPPDLDARILSHKLLALGTFSEEVESNLFSFFDLKVTTRGSSVVATQLDLLGTWEHAGAVTDISITERGAGELLLAVASSTGGISFIRLQLPRTPGTGPEDIQLLSLPTEEDDQQRFTASVTPHKAAALSVDVHADSQAVLTVGADGAICVFSPDTGAGEDVAPFRRSTTGSAGYTNARWADTNTFVTAGYGGLDCWDLRQGGGAPAARSPKAWGPTGRAGAVLPSTSGPAKPPAAYPQPLSGPPQVHWLAVHPSRPNMCASGATGGEVVVWDLRFASQPLLVACDSASWQGGDVWEVKFDPHSGQGAAGAAAPGVVFCTQRGTLGLAGASGAGSVLPGRAAVPTTLATSAQGFNSFDVQGGDIVALTDAQELVYVRRQ